MKDQNIEETVKCIDNKECGKVVTKKVELKERCLWSGQRKTPIISHQDQEGKYT